MEPTHTFDEEPAPFERPPGQSGARLAKGVPKRVDNTLAVAASTTWDAAEEDDNIPHNSSHGAACVRDQKITRLKVLQPRSNKFTKLVEMELESSKDLSKTSSLEQTTMTVPCISIRLILLCFAVSSICIGTAIVLCVPPQSPEQMTPPAFPSSPSAPPVPSAPERSVSPAHLRPSAPSVPRLPSRPPLSPPLPPPPFNPPPSVPSPPHAMAVVDRLNARFCNGHPSNQLDEAGVLMRQIHKGAQKPWLPSSQAKRADRFPSSLVNQHLCVLHNSEPGFVVSSAVSLLCYYHSDGASDGKTCSTPGVSPECIPGCWKAAGWSWGNAQHPALWCERPSNTLPRGRLYGCAWKPDNLEGMVQSHLERGGGGHNEVVIDAHSWMEQLPGAIEALFFIKQSDAGHVKGLRANIMHTYGLREEQAPPLVKYDVRRGLSPFVLWTP
jgi:hypothetical protein